MEDQKQSQVLKALEALKKASKEIETNAADEGDCNSPSMKALLELETGSDDLLSGDPHLSTLSHLLSRLKSLSSSLRSKHLSGSGGLNLRSFLRRRSSGLELSRVAGSIGSEIQSWIDRETLDRLISSLRSNDDEETTTRLLLSLESRLSQGFDRDLQDLILRSGVFAAVESALANQAASKPVRERSAAAVLALVRFNKDVFVGQVLMGPTVRSLISISSPAALRALNGLIAAIRSPIIDLIQSNGEIPRIIALLASGEVEIRVLALDCVLEIGYFGRKEAIDGMMEEALIKRLAELQRSDLGGAMIEMGGGGGGGEEGGEVRVGGVGKERRGDRERRFLEAHPFASAVARFAIQAEVGEGLRQREKRSFKLEVIRRLREAVISHAEEATMLAEVLWGSTP